MTRRFEGKQIVVTGAGKDIGRAISRRFAQEGGDVMLVGRTHATLAQTADLIASDGGTAWIHTADVTSHNDIEQLVSAALSHAGRIDVLINNAGDRDETPFLEMTADRWDEVFSTNLRAPFLLSQRVAREMATSGGGVILHNASIDVSGADGTFASYNSSKTGLLGLNRTMALELAPHNIRVNLICPGYVESSNLAMFVGDEVARTLMTEFDRVPMRRMVKVEEVAAAFAFMASDDASGITGTELRVDCGLTANLYVLETLRAGREAVSAT
jgi:NAD(P)-dependent dehydrogenase (short-subunit alcohol dehydrogenase family)